ncbi:eCIS core domain-containing protein [Kutzneria chonburiensis]|uniref:DUF4157 domain-containing protein n=1 Tax=Kutzneria chonburiensis TaxID=1483604 RepID=A0ABV6MMI8_9PSEU|nr:DUF4157 domain-containing protein [Kutzneria chonburiensis]
MLGQQVQAKAPAANQAQQAGGAPPARRPERDVRRAVGNNALAAGALDALDGPGTPIAASLRAGVERATGQDLSDVRLHTGPRVRVAAVAASAAGFTIGRDIGIATAPGQDIPQALLEHELVHAAQQSGVGSASAADAESQARQGIGALGVLASASAPYVAWAPEDWARGATPEVSQYSLSDLLDELTAIDDWMDRQLANGTEAMNRVLAARVLIQAEVDRRRRGVNARRSAYRPTPLGPEPEIDKPHVLENGRRAPIKDLAEARAEADRVAAWLQRSDVSPADRVLLQQELRDLQPQLSTALTEARVNRQTARLRQALTPADPTSKASVLANLRILESISPYPPIPGKACVVHHGELLVFSQELADWARANALRGLTDAARRARGMNTASTNLVNGQIQTFVNDQWFVGGLVRLVSGESPQQLQAKMSGPLAESTGALARFDRAGSMVDMAEAVFAAVEKADEAQRIVQAGVDRSNAALNSLLTGTEIVRDVSTAVAVSVAAVLAAPVVAGWVAGAGITGASSVVVTALGTGTLVGTGGVAAGFVEGTGTGLLSGRSVSDSARLGGAEAYRLGSAGFLAGLGGGTAKGLTTVLGADSVGLSVGTTFLRNGIAQGGGNAVSGIAGGLLAPPAGLDRGDAALRGGVGGLTVGFFGGGVSSLAPGLTSPLARWGVNAAAPAAVTSGVTYLQTGSGVHTFVAGSAVLLQNSLTLNRAPGISPETLESSFQLGQGARRSLVWTGRTGVAGLTAVTIGLSNVEGLRATVPGDLSTETPVGLQILLSSTRAPTVDYARPSAAPESEAQAPTPDSPTAEAPVATVAPEVVSEAPAPSVTTPVPTPAEAPTSPAQAGPTPAATPTPAAAPTPAATPASTPVNTVPATVTPTTPRPRVDLPPLRQPTGTVTEAQALSRRPVLARELAALASATDPASVARRAELQARLTRLRLYDEISVAPRQARLLEVSKDRNAPNYWEVVASVVPQPGTVLEFEDGSRVWREKVGGEIWHESTLGGGIGRAGYERAQFSAREHGRLPNEATDQRLHALGQGTGFESPYSILRGHPFINQRLQNSGIELYLRELNATAAEGEIFRVVTPNRPRQFSQRFAHQDYLIMRYVDNRVEWVATYSIDVTFLGARRMMTAWPIEFTPAGEAIRGRVPIPEVLTTFEQLTE